MKKNSRSPWRSARAEALRVELLEERRLLNGSDDFAGRGFVADAEWPDEETHSAENGSAAEVEYGEDYEFESDDGFVETEDYEVEWDVGSIPEAGDLPSYNEAEDDGAEEGEEAISWAPLATGASDVIQSFEDDREQAPTSQPSGQDANYPAASSPAAAPQAPGGSSNIVNGQGGNTTSTPPSTTMPTDGGQSHPAEIDEADEAFEATHAVAQPANESHTVSEARSPVARQARIPTGPSVDVQAEAAHLSVATPSSESAATEPAAKPDSAAPPLAAAAESADARATDQSAPAIHAADKANPITGQPHQKETIDTSEKVETSVATVEPSSFRSLVAYSAPLISTQLPLAAIVDAALATPPQVAGLLTDFISIDMASIEREIDNILGKIDGFRRELAGSLAELNLPTWFLAAAVGAAAAEVVRLQRKRVPGALAAVVRDGDSSTWLPDSAGPAPEELT